MLDGFVFLAIIISVELLRRKIVVAIARKIATPEQFEAYHNSVGY